jgi:hypothetical protein
MSTTKIIQIIVLTLLIIFSGIFIYFFIGEIPPSKNPEFGIVFSQKHARDLGLNWKIAYKKMLSELEVKDVKLITHWDLLEPKKNNFNFRDLDWQLNEAQKQGVDVTLVIGMKTGRWPECHLPEWAKELSEEEQKERVIELVKVLAIRYEESSPIVAWGIENEPLFSFGDCPWTDKEVLKKEIETVRGIDSYYKRPILITDSGEGSFWIEAAKLGDIVGVTMYREVWFNNLERYVSYRFPPFFYWKKQDFIEKMFDKEVVCSELQAEPWCPNLLYNCSLEEQMKSMTIDQFKENIEFARQTGLDKFYLWGSEWWYWMKENQNQPQIWNEAKTLF